MQAEFKLYYKILPPKTVHQRGTFTLTGARNAARMGRIPKLEKFAMTAPSSSEIVIQGLTKSGKPFRPSDWAERLAGVMSVFGADHRMSYSPYVKPVTFGGVRSVWVDKKLFEIEPRAYNFLLSFARDNELQVVDGAQGGEGAGAPA